MPPRISDACTSCGHCARVCPGDILHVTDGVLEVRYPAECSNCGICATECPEGAIEIRFAWNALQTPVELNLRERTTDA